MIENVKFLEQLDELGIPRDKILIGGSATLALYEIRPNKDLDVAVSKDIFAKLMNDDRFTKKEALSGILLSYKDIEVFDNNWPFDETVEEELKNCLVIDGYHFYTLPRFIEWKRRVNRPKDREDLELIWEKSQF